MSDHDHAPKNLAPAKAHIVSFSTLIVVWIVLCAGAVLNLLLNSVHMGGSDVLVSLVIASVMATISALYFMHLRYDNFFNMVIMILAFLFVTLFITWSSMDVVNYRDQLNSGEAQAMISASHAQSASHGSGNIAKSAPKPK
jgi:cytochrome c oxidase subunit 4